MDAISRAGLVFRVDNERTTRRASSVVAFVVPAFCIPASASAARTACDINSIGPAALSRLSICCATCACPTNTGV